MNIMNLPLTARGYNVYDADDNYICDCRSLANETDSERAKIIARSVNCHTYLVAALEAIYAHYVLLKDSSTPTIEQARSALDKAKA